MDIQSVPTIALHDVGNRQFWFIDPDGTIVGPCTLLRWAVIGASMANGPDPKHPQREMTHYLNSRAVVFLEKPLDGTQPLALLPEAPPSPTRPGGIGIFDLHMRD